MWGTQITTPRNHRTLLKDRWLSLGGGLSRDTNISIIHPCDINVDPLAACPTLLPYPTPAWSPHYEGELSRVRKNKIQQTSKKRQPAVLVEEMGGMIS